MTIARIYQAKSLAVDQLVALDHLASHHLARVLRATVGEEVIVFNGQGGEYLSKIERIDKRQVQVKVLQFDSREVESPLHLCLAQGMARGEKMDMIIQKAVELGAQSIQPLITERCNVRLDETREQKRLAHWQHVIISACEQSGRNRLPTIHPPMVLTTWLAASREGIALVLSPHRPSAVRLRDLTCLPHQAITLLIGPEGGLSDEEIDASIVHGFKPLLLGPRILRTETAPLAVVAALQACFGDL